VVRSPRATPEFILEREPARDCFIRQDFLLAEPSAFRLNTAMHIIDVNTSIGKRVDEDPRYSPAALRAELDAHQVAAALTYSQRGVDYDYRTGNREVTALHQMDPWILPVGILDPRDPQGWTEDLEYCREQGVKAIRFFQVAQRWSTQSALFQKLLKQFQGHTIALMFSSIDSYTGWDGPLRVAQMTADLGVPVIFMDTYYANMVEVIEVMRAFPHVYLETHWLAAVAAVEQVVGEVGADRVLYGSGHPARPMQKALNQVLEAAISPAEKEAILGQNARRLFSLASNVFAGRPVLSDYEPRRFDEKIIDIHTHLGFWHRQPHEEYDPTRMIERMKRYNIRCSIVSAAESIRYDTAAGNAAIAQVVARHPELKGYVELNPLQYELSCAEMKRYLPRPEFAGVEIELTHIPCPTGGPQVHALMAEIARYGKPVLFMPATGGDAEAERDLARSYPTVQLVHAHGFDSAWAHIVADTPNISVEFCLSSASHHHLRDALDILGPERVLFGTDQALLGVGGQIGLYLDARMTAHERQLVLRDNARRLYKISGYAP
jgi:predicted TIM-barrel fold metal-dependent hydrolase